MKKLFEILRSEITFLMDLYITESYIGSLRSYQNNFRTSIITSWNTKLIFEPVHEISNNVVCATSKVSDQPAQTRSLIRAFASRLSIL